MSLWTTSTSSSCNPFYYMYYLLIFCSTSTSSIQCVHNCIGGILKWGVSFLLCKSGCKHSSFISELIPWFKLFLWRHISNARVYSLFSTFFFYFRVCIAKRIFFKGHACGSNGWNDLCLRHARSLIKLSSQTVRYMLPVNLAQCALVPFIFQESRSVI